MLVASEVPWSRIWHLSFAEKNNKDISVSTETHSNHDQIHHQIHIRANWLGPIFLSPGEFSLTQKDRLSCFIRVLKASLRLTLIQKVIPLFIMTYFAVFMPLQGIAPGNSWLGGVSLKDFKIIWKRKNEGNENKLILEDFNCTMDKMDRYGGNKTQRLYRWCSNYALIVDNGMRICGEGKT